MKWTENEEGTPLKENLIIIHGGGPTAVLNCSLYGAVREAQASGLVEHVYGAVGGTGGLLKEKLLDFGSVPEEELERLPTTPATAIGTSRDALEAEDYARMADILAEKHIRYVLMNGGNGTMDACGKLAAVCRDRGISVMGIPKTMDNDIAVTDHCPGFGSVARYMAGTVRELGVDVRSLPIHVVVLEALGRNAGWTTAAAALAGEYGAGPDLIYLPEVDFSMTQFIEDVKRVYAEKGSCIVAVSEGIHYEDGGFVSEAKVAANDGFGHAQLGGLAAMLAQVLKEETGAKVRGIELSLLQRCGSHLASKTDVDEAWLAGSAAVEAAVSGTTDKMVAFHCTRDNGEYHCEIALEPLDIVANFEKKVPREWINKEGNGVEQPFIDYVLPLIQGETEAVKKSALPRFAHLKKVLTTSMK